MALNISRSSPYAIIAAFVTLSVAGCHTTQSGDSTYQTSEKPLRKADHILIADDLEITFSGVPSRAPILTVRVGSDGAIKLPYNVTLTAAGKTTTALADDVRAAYVPRHFPHLEASITILEFGCLVLGEVRSCGSLRGATSNLSVLRAIAASGGPTSHADLENIELRRRNGEIIKVDWKKARKNPKLDPLVTLTGGDVIMVPRKSSSRRAF